jgi:hypothetical protein
MRRKSGSNEGWRSKGVKRMGRLPCGAAQAAGGRMETMKKAARSNGRLELPLLSSAPSPLGRKLMRLRKKIEASGVKLLTSAEVDREVLRRRGLA